LICKAIFGEEEEEKEYEMIHSNQLNLADEMKCDNQKIG